MKRLLFFSSPGSQRPIWAGILGGVSLLALGGCTPPKPAAGVGAPPEVLVTKVQPQVLPIHKEWIGTLDGSANVAVRARVQGYLISKDYQPGREVKSGDLLFAIDARPFEASLAQARADLAKAQASQTKAELDEGRQNQLFASKAGSAADRDAAVQNNAAAKASVAAAQAAVQAAEINLGFTKMTAPVDGIVGFANPGIGDLVGPTSGDLTTISTVDPIKAKFQISEQEYYRIAERLKAAAAQSEANPQANLELILADGSVFPQKGAFSAADRQIDSKTGTLRLEALFPNPGGVLRPGFFARIRGMVRKEEAALAVPQRAVMELQGNYQIAVVGADGKAEVRPVKVGDRVGTQWIITEGLKPGEDVVVEGVQKVRPGMPVSAKPWGAQAQPQPEAK